ncbi:MAG: hypothetical protein ACRCVU_04715 [Flavobacterium sp.]
MNSFNYIRFLAYFPITGIIGIHRKVLWNNSIFFGRIFLFLFGLIYTTFNPESNFLKYVCLFLIASWIYDVINIRKIYDNTIAEIDKTVDEIITYGINGEYGKMTRKLFYKGKTNVYINRLLQSDKSLEFLSKFSINEEEINYVRQIIAKRDVDTAITFITQKIGTSIFS